MITLGSEPEHRKCKYNKDPSTSQSEPRTHPKPRGKPSAQGLTGPTTHKLHRPKGLIYHTIIYMSRQ
jgi:hypothetical protein